MKTIANAQPLPAAVALNIDVRATLMRRVLPLGLTLALWAVVIQSLRLVF
ncbi:hypothetical protein [Caulobacter sp.]|nr:hypothetical protein [Caulobacter sp.]MBO9543473.1 hypothetical protein [Caulobacter sp.]